MKLEQRIKGICQKIYIILIDLVAKEKCQKRNETISNIEHISAQQKKPTENYLCCHVHVGSSKRFSTQTIFLRDHAEEWLYLCFSVCVCGKDVLCACVSLLQ